MTITKAVIITLLIMISSLIGIGLIDASVSSIEAKIALQQMSDSAFVPFLQHATISNIAIVIKVILIGGVSYLTYSTWSRITTPTTQKEEEK